MDYVNNNRVWSSNNFLPFPHNIRALSLMLMVMYENIPKDTSIYKSAHEIRDDFLFDCRMSRYGEQYNTTAECSQFSLEC